ncbi:guanyl-specific ribonuclease f1 [Colletotrichum plurivorum]|uniref:ribonuclease T1 n=1 Tax=Colletotrichum plurivorum TaxID=2175906 RepID=A0A8H6N740_9PEZI|nr:guanyl-specific ribonuclease f1 [Colletotrichum plurivorum]
MHFGAGIIVALGLTAHASLRHGYLRMVPRANDTAISCAGSSSYPHTYRNQERFEFGGVDGPFVEFPMKTSAMKTSGVYDGADHLIAGKPGPDRIIINEECVLAGQITHTGANGNAFVGCEGTS